MYECTVYVYVCMYVVDLVFISNVLLDVYCKHLRALYTYIHAYILYIYNRSFIQQNYLIVASDIMYVCMYVCMW